MSFLSTVLPIAGAVAGSIFAPGIGTALGATIGSGAGAAIGGGLGGLAGNLIDGGSSGQAADAQSNAAQTAANTQLQMFQQNKADLAPWLQSGLSGNAALMNYLGIGAGGSFNPNAPGVAPFNGANFQQDPSYQWRLQQGENALLNNASRLGGLGGGNTMKALQEYGQGAASQEYQNAFNRYNTEQGNVYNRIAGLSNTGANAAAGIAGLGANTANNVSSLQAAQGQYQAAGILGQQAATNSGINNALSNWLYASAQQQGQPTSMANANYQPLNIGPYLPETSGYDFGGQ